MGSLAYGCYWIQTPPGGKWTCIYAEITFCTTWAAWLLLRLFLEHRCYAGRSNRHFLWLRKQKKIHPIFSILGDKSQAVVTESWAGIENLNSLVMNKYDLHTNGLCFLKCYFRKNMQRNRQMAMGRKKFNMDPAKVNTFMQQCFLLSCEFSYWLSVCFSLV